MDGITFDSKIEATRYSELKMLEKAGEIRDLKRQVEFMLIPKSRRVKRARKYIADFYYFENGKPIVEDVKGIKTAVYTLKRDILLSDRLFIATFREYSEKGIKDFL